MTLLEIADACERANGADRELDAAISAIIEPYENSFYHRQESPRYTTSMDAAMSLLRSAWGYEQRRSSGDGKQFYVIIWWVPDFPNRAYGTGKSPALALTSAALRARHAMAMEEK